MINIKELLKLIPNDIIDLEIILSIKDGFYENISNCTSL